MTEPHGAAISYPTSARVVDLVVDAPDTLVIVLDLTGYSTVASGVEFWIQLPAGADIDLHHGDEITVDYSSSGTMPPDGPGTVKTLEMTRSDDRIVFARMIDFKWDVADAADLDIAGLTFVEAEGVCEPVFDPSYHTVIERMAVVTTCGETGWSETVFDRGEAFLECGAGYYLKLGRYSRNANTNECCDLTYRHEEVLLLKHGDGLSSP